jgi:hypothetical protein
VPQSVDAEAESIRKLLGKPSHRRSQWFTTAVISHPTTAMPKPTTQ